MRKNIVVGEYNHYGYTLFDPTGIKELYSAGNNPVDSEQFLPLGDPKGLSLKTIRSFCIKTGKEMAEEKGWKWGGACRIDDGSYGGVE